MGFMARGMERIEELAFGERGGCEVWGEMRGQW